MLLSLSWVLSTLISCFLNLSCKMESWRYDYLTTTDAVPMGITDFGNSVVFASQNAISIENQRFEDMCFPHIVSNSLFNPVMVATHNAFCEGNESSSKKLDSFFESNCIVSRQFECNFDKNVNQENLINFSSSKITKNLSSSEASMPTKLIPIPVFGSSTPFCQVHGCNKKLTSCKDYHKRHKVCEMHSKSAKVIVNGIQQRFCQQCSRFHVLSEFDNGKRSCRRRLADHNQRRRKPHGNARDDPANSKVKGSTRPRATSSSAWHIELEDETINDLRSMSSMTDVQLQYSSLHGSNSAFCPFINKDQTGGTDDDMLTNDPTPARSLLPSQSDSTSSCHSSRNPQRKPLIHNVRRTNNMNNPLVGSESANHETQVWSDDESTIDLLQLSSELMRVEHQKEIIHMKCAHECC